MSEGPGASLHLELCMSAHPLSVAAARSVVRALRNVPAEPRDRVELIVSELVTNAIRHGSRRADDRVDLVLAVVPHEVNGCVRDHGPAFEVPEFDIDPGRGSGFGLCISSRLADTLTVDHSDAGNAVCFSVRSTSGPPCPTPSPAPSPSPYAG